MKVANRIDARGWCLVDGRDGAPAICYGDLVVGLSPALCFALRRLIAAHEAQNHVPALQGYVISVDLVEAGGAVEARAVVRGLRAAFGALGLADMVRSHERFGYCLAHPPTAIA